MNLPSQLQTTLSKRVYGLELYLSGIASVTVRQQLQDALRKLCLQLNSGCIRHLGEGEDTGQSERAGGQEGSARQTYGIPGLLVLIPISSASKEGAQNQSQNSLWQCIS